MVYEKCTYNFIETLKVQFASEVEYYPKELIFHNTFPRPLQLYVYISIPSKKVNSKENNYLTKCAEKNKIT